MTFARLAAVLAVAALVAIGGVFGAAALAPFGVVGAQTETPDPATEPTLASFNSTEPVCVDGIHERTSSDVRTVNGNTTVNLSGNVSLPDTNYVLNTTGLVREGPGNYSLNVTSNETDDPAQNCSAQAGYDLSVRIPPTDEPVTVTVRVDGEPVTTVRSEEGSTSVSSSRES